MTVAELIAELQGHPPDARVVVGDYRQGGDDTEAGWVVCYAGTFYVDEGGRVARTAYSHLPGWPKARLNVVRVS